MKKPTERQIEHTAHAIIAVSLASIGAVTLMMLPFTIIGLLWIKPTYRWFARQTMYSVDVIRFGEEQAKENRTEKVATVVERKEAKQQAEADAEAAKQAEKEAAKQAEKEETPTFTAWGYFGMMITGMGIVLTITVIGAIAGIPMILIGMVIMGAGTKTATNHREEKRLEVEYQKEYNREMLRRQVADDVDDHLGVSEQAD